MEQWRSIDRYPSYEVSTEGRVRRIGATCARKPVRLKNGYMSIMFYRNKKYCLEYVHRLVAEAFLPREEGKTQVNHKDLDRGNNKVENLEWCDAMYNVQYSQSRRVEQLTLRGEHVATYRGVRDAERAMHVGHGRIGLCALGGAKTAHGYMWRYI